MHGLKCKCCNCTTCFKHQRVYRYRQMNQLFHGRWQKQVMKLKSHVKICLTRSSRFYQINIIKKILRAFWFFITGKSTHAINTINNGSFQKSQSVTESRPFLTVINQNVFMSCSVTLFKTQTWCEIATSSFLAALSGLLKYFYQPQHVMSFGVFWLFPNVSNIVISAHTLLFLFRCIISAHFCPVHLEKSFFPFMSVISNYQLLS